jgi:hypothetical protein
MKSLWFLFLWLFLWQPCLLADTTVVVGQGVASGGSCDDCSGSTTFSWHMEDLNVATGTPCGCSDGDEDGTANGGATLSDAQKYDGSKSLLSGNDDYISFASTNILTMAGEGTVSFYVYVADWTANTGFTEYWGAKYDADNMISCYSQYDGSNTDFTFRIEGSNDNLLRTVLDADTSGISATWIRIMCSWDVNDDAVDSAWFWVDLDADGVVDEGEYAVTTTGTVGNMTGASTFNIGDSDCYADGDDVSYIDNFYITNSYQDSL